MIDVKNQLKHKRTYFIGDRVALSQSLLLFLTGVLVHVLTMNDMPSTTVTVLVFLAVIGTVCSWVFIEAFKVRLFFESHWLVLFALLSCFWLPVTILMGYVIDTFLQGFGNTFYVSMLVMVNYAVGYVLARLLYSASAKIDKKKMTGIAIWMVVLINLVAVPLGLLFNNIHVIVSGIGISLSLMFSYLMLHSLFDEGGMDVVDDPPNKLYMVCLRNSMFCTLLFWVIVETFLPIVPGGGGGKKSRGRGGGVRSTSSSRRSSRRYGRYHNGRVLLPPKQQQILNVRTYKGYPDTVSDEEILREIVEGEWAEHKLEGYHDPPPIVVQNHLWYPPTWVRAEKTSDPSIGNYNLQFNEQALQSLPDEQRTQLLRRLNEELKAILESQSGNKDASST